MAFVMQPVPHYFTMMQRIQRWALLVKKHPMLCRFDTEQFVKDLPKSFVDDLAFTKPIMKELMEEYKIHKEGIPKICATAGDTSKEGYDQCCKDCNFAIENFFQGNWGLLTIGEYAFLFNAAQMKGPEDFDSDTYAKFHRVYEAFRLIREVMVSCGAKKLAYRMEEVMDESTRLIPL